jgi:RNA polymerase sigma-70 factor (ECF subfamily)
VEPLKYPSLAGHYLYRDLHEGGSAPEATLALTRNEFEELFKTNRGAVLSYARRRMEEQDAIDVVADTFLVAWRRSGDIPDEPLPWLLGVARRIISTKRRSTSRLTALRTKMQGSTSQPLAPSANRLEIADAFRSLSDKDREVLMLVAWDGLDVHQAAQLQGCTSASFSVRLHRARKRLETKLAPDSSTAALTAKVEECS